MDRMRAGRSPTSIGEAKQRADQATLNFISSSEPAPAPAARSVVRVNLLTADNVRMGSLSAVAGFVDAAGFATLVGLFPAHVTGELVGAAVAVSSGHLADELHRLVIIPIFIGAVIVGATVSRACRLRARSPLVPLLVLMSGLLAFFGMTDFLLPRLELHRPELETALREGSVVAAMALQNVIMRQVLSTSYPTTVMTGNLTQFIIELVELAFAKLWRSKEERQRARQKADLRLRLVGTTLGLFLTSAVLGGFLTASFGSISVLVPALAVATLAVSESRRKTPVSRMGTLF
jgi:uncharacterized membrane protein YoaK (UPF0700 family)